MKSTKALLAAAALCMMLPAASFAQSSTTMPAPRAGDASTGGSGGGNTGTNAKATESTGSTTSMNASGSMHASAKCKTVLAHPSKYSKSTVANCR